MKTSSNAEEFLDTYNMVEAILNKQGQFDEYITFSQKVKKLSERKNVIRQFKDELISYSELRNAIVHTPKIDGQVIAEPHISTVVRLKSIYNTISNPKKVIPAFSSTISGAGLEDKINNILVEIGEKSFSQFPIIENKRVVELINTNTIARWLSKSFETDGSVVVEAIRVKDLLPHIEFKNNYKFISKDKDVFYAYDLFIDYINKNKRNLDVLFITETGKEQEALLGWITIEDIAIHIRD